MNEGERQSALAFAYTLLGYLQAEHEIFNEYKKKNMDFEESFGYRLITKIIEILKGA